MNTKDTSNDTKREDRFGDPCTRREGHSHSVRQQADEFGRHHY